MKHKYLKLLLVVLMGMAGLNVSAYDIAVENADGVTIYYNFINEGTELSVCQGNGVVEDFYSEDYSGSVVIPASVSYEDNIYPVTSIGKWAFQYCLGLTAVTIPNSVTFISEYAFSWCENLSSVYIPNSVTAIGDAAFIGCSKLTSITIPNSVTTVGKEIFDSTGLSSPLYNATVFFYMPPSYEGAYTIPDGITTIAGSAFSYCTGLTSITIPDCLASVGAGAFDGTGLTSPVYNAHVFVFMPRTYEGAYTIPDGITSIGGSAFSRCTGLTSITIPDDVTDIGGSAFWLCTGLTSITIPDGVTSIGSWAFSRCTGLSSLTIPSNVSTINESTFAGCTALSSITIPEGVTSIDDYAFEGCSNLTTVSIPNSLTTIGSAVFNGCTRLSSPLYNANLFVRMPTSFSGSYTIPSGITTIANQAFLSCTGLTSVTIPNSVTTIGVSAFNGCTGLTTIDIPNSVSTIGDYAFAHCSNLAAPVIFKTKLLHMPSSYSGEYTIPSGVTMIDVMAFYECKSLTAVNIPGSVKTIGESAFWDCSNLSSVTMENGVETIGGGAFAGCSSLTSMTFPSSVTYIGRRALYDVSWLRTLVFDNCVPKFGTMVIDDAYSKPAMDVYFPAYAYDYYSTYLNCPIGPTLHPQIKIDREWTTYCATASFDVPDGIEAYVVKNYEDGVVTLKKVTTINEGEGLLLKPAEVGTFYDATVNDSPAAYDSNLLKGVTEATAIEATDGEYTNFIFTKVGDEIGFYPTNSGTIPAYKAYLQIPTASLSASAAREGLSIVFENDETAVRTVSAADSQDNDNWYTLGGQRIAKPTQQGIYIHQSKKVVLK